jgi:hypothetical protein
VRQTLKLRRKFGHLVSQQSKLLENFATLDYSERSVENLVEGATLLDDLIGHEREAIELAESLSVTIRYWWKDSLKEMTAQVDHLESISESFHAACDPEVRALLASSVDLLSVSGS